MSQIFISLNNSSTTPLAANATFVGTSDALTSWEEIDVNVAVTPPNATGTLYFEFSPDNIHWDVSVPLFLTGTNVVPIHLRSILPYFRVRYINGPVAQAEFRLTTVFHRTASSRLIRFLSQSIDVNEPIQVDRAVMAGQHPDNSFGNIQISADGYMLSDVIDRSGRVLGHVIVDSGTLTVNQGSNPWIVSGIVTSNIGTTGGLALDATLTNGSARTKITDGSNNATVKPASTAVSTTDAALVVGVSPNTPIIPTPSTDNTSSTNLSSLNSFATVSSIGCSHVAIDVSGTWSGSILLTASIDGNNFFEIGAYAITDTEGSKSSSASLGTDIITANGQWIITTRGYATVKATMTSYISGTATMFMRATISAASEDIQAIIFGDSGAVDAFSRLRTSHIETLFSSKQLFDNQPLYWDDQQISGAGTTSTFLTNKAATQLSVLANTTGVRVRQSFRRMNYQPGHSQLVTFTGVLVAEGGAGNTAIKRRIGLYDGSNGVFFELIGTTLNVAVRTNSTGTPVTTYIPQSSWNLDKMDGTGASGVVLDVSKAQIFLIDFQWLGVGRIRYGFNINGVTLYCHQILNANIQSGVYMSVPNLPIRYEIESLGTGTNTTCSMLHICSGVYSEGGQEDVGFTFGIDMGATQLTTGNDTNVYALLAMQLKPGYLAATVFPTFFTIASSTANAQFRVILTLNSTIAGPALSYTSVTNSALQYAVGTNTNLITDGTVIYSGYFQSNKNGSATDKLTIDVALGSFINGTSDTLVLAIQPVPHAALSFSASFNWKEQI